MSGEFNTIQVIHICYNEIQSHYSLIIFQSSELDH